MKIEQLKLVNFQSYANAQIDFNDGTTMIYGDNGAGKSSILRAIFGALYQTNALTELSGSYSLDDLVQKNKSEGSVELTFSVEENMYTVYWSIEVSEENGERKGSTKECTLTGDSIDGSIEGVRSVRQKVTELVGMGPKEFANSVYVQQKRFSRLVEANETERKEILDALLGLDEIDAYIDRMKRARRPVKKRRDGAQARLKEVRDRINNYNKDDLENKRDRLRGKIRKLNNELEKRESRLEKIEEQMARSKQKKREVKKALKRKNESEERLSKKKNKKSQLQSDIESDKDDIESKRDTVNTLEEKIESKSEEFNNYSLSTLQETQNAIESVRDNKDQYYKKKQEITQDIRAIKDEISRIRDDINNHEEKLSLLEDGVEQKKSKIEDLLSDVAEIPVTTEKHSDMFCIATQNWAEANNIDIDGTDVRSLNSVIESLEDRKEQVNEELAQVDANIDGKIQSIQDKESEKEELEDDYENVVKTVDSDISPLEEHQEQIEKAKELGDGLDIQVDGNDVLSLIETDVNQAHQKTLDEYHEMAVSDSSKEPTLDEKKETLQKLNELSTVLAKSLRFDRIVSIKELIEEVDSRIISLQERKDELKDKKETLKTRKSDIESRISELETLVDVAEDVQTVNEKKNEKDELKDDIEELERDLSEKRDTKKKLQSDKEQIESNYSSMEEKLSQLSTVADAHERIQKLKDSVDMLVERISDKQERISDINEDISDIQSDISQEEEQLESMKGINEIEDYIEEMEELVEKLNDSIGDHKDKIDDSKAEMTSVDKELSTLQEERKRESQLENRVQEYQQINTDLDDLIEVYNDVKLNIRQETLGNLNKYSNDVFRDIYQSESYTGLRIDQDYNIRLVTSDGGEIDPDKCSGGEGVLTNIALRAGVYRVISDRDETGGKRLPPFIMDEPTNHLDDGHVSQIEEVIHSIQSWDVPQVIVVSHRESLMTSADTEIEVQKKVPEDVSVVTVKNR